MPHLVQHVNGPATGAMQAQGLVGAVQHPYATRPWLRGGRRHVLSGGAGGVTVPMQGAGCGNKWLAVWAVNHGPAPGVGGVGVVAIRWTGHADAAALPRHSQAHASCGYALNRFAGAGGQYDPAWFHAVKTGQGVAQSGVRGIGVTAGIGLLHRLQHGGERAAGDAVGEKISARRAACVGPPVLALWHSVLRRGGGENWKPGHGGDATRWPSRPAAPAPPCPR